MKKKFFFVEFGSVQIHCFHPLLNVGTFLFKSVTNDTAKKSIELTEPAAIKLALLLLVKHAARTLIVIEGELQVPCRTLRVLTKTYFFFLRAKLCVTSRVDGTQKCSVCSQRLLSSCVLVPLASSLGITRRLCAWMLAGNAARGGFSSAPSAASRPWSLIGEHSTGETTAGNPTPLPP